MGPVPPSPRKTTNTGNINFGVFLQDPQNYYFYNCCSWFLFARSSFNKIIFCELEEQSCDSVDNSLGTGQDFS